jgi:ATP-dependent Lon protease
MDVRMTVNGLGIRDTEGAVVPVQTTIRKGTGKISMRGRVTPSLRDCFESFYQTLAARETTRKRLRDRNIEVSVEYQGLPIGGSSIGLAIAAGFLGCDMLYMGKQSVFVRRGAAYSGALMGMEVHSVNYLDIKLHAAELAGIQYVYVPENSMIIAPHSALHIKKCRHITDVIEFDKDKSTRYKFNQWTNQGSLPWSG